jgi:hypothetical protein
MARSQKHKVQKGRSQVVNVIRFTIADSEGFIEEEDLSAAVTLFVDMVTRVFREGTSACRVQPPINEIG